MPVSKSKSVKPYSNEKVEARRKIEKLREQKELAKLTGEIYD